MHELSVAQHIAEIVKGKMPHGYRGRISTISLRIGEHAGIVTESLTFCFDVVTEGTPLEGAKLKIQVMPFVIACRNCNQSSRQEDGLFICPLCGGTDVQPLSGMELDIIEFELTEEGVPFP